MSIRLFSRVPRCSALAPVSSRTFTSSAARRATVVTFKPTSSPELDALLARYRNKIFVPAQLSLDKLSIIHNTENTEKLEKEPLGVHIGGEEFSLGVVDKTQLPPIRKGIRQAIGLMKEKSDWDNLLILLAGLKGAKRIIPETLWAQIIRKGADAGHLNIIMECVRSSKSGFDLGNVELILKVMQRIHEKAKVSGWKPEETKRALSWAQDIAKLVEDVTHVTYEGRPPKSDSLVVGGLLELAAVRCQQVTSPESKEALSEEDKTRVVERVSVSATRLLGTDTNKIQMPKKENDEQSEKKTDSPYIHSCNRYLTSLIPTLHGLKVTETILEPSTQLAKDIKIMNQRLDGLAGTLRKLLVDNPQKAGQEYRSVVEYNKLKAGTL